MEKTRRPWIAPQVEEIDVNRHTAWTWGYAGGDIYSGS